MGKPLFNSGKSMQPVDDAGAIDNAHTTPLLALATVLHPPGLRISHSQRRRMLLKINGLSHLTFVNIKPIESTTYAFYAASNAASFELTC
jgi:hypothetical protein